MNTNIVKQFVVVGSNGQVDVAASAEAFKSALLKYQTERETATEVVSDSVLAVFAEYPGKRLPRDFITNRALTALNAQPANSASLTNLIGEFLKTSPLLNSKKGSGGGTMLASEVPATEAK